jgi:DNA invertase Pin-like site-specific DNA recombinase
MDDLEGRAKPLAGAASPVHAAEYVRMSTDHQRYSMANQSALIHAYAASHRMVIVQTYADPGRTGLTLRDRPGLAALLADIVAGKAGFDVVLVYDVSRWGRFQDADEGAHYEFLCRRAGIKVIYCAEQFSGDGTPFDGVLKALKRAMAGEYSRELSIKVAAGKARIGGLGFRVGGIAGYGLRRQVLEDGIRPGQVLAASQRKAVQSDRVTLVPGPPEEIALVRRMYRDYIYLGRSERQIAADLDAERCTFYGRPWSRNLVRTVLCNEKYIGNNIVGQFCQRMRSPTVIRPRAEWVRCEGAFEAIVSRETFEAAAKVRAFNEKKFVSRGQILDAMRLVLHREGKLTAAIINAAPELPSANTVELRFGSLGQAYEVLGYGSPVQYGHHAVDRALASIRERVIDELLLELPARAVRDREGFFTLGSELAVAVITCRFQQPRPNRCGWRISYKRTPSASVLVAARMAAGNRELRDILVIPPSAVAPLPLFLQEKHDEMVAPWKHPSIKSAALALLSWR